MSTTTFAYSQKEVHRHSKLYQPKWLRIILLIVLGYEAAGCLAGGILLVAEPDGRLMKMPVDMMHGTFPDFLVPGILLIGLGILNTIAFISVLRRKSSGWIMAGISLVALLIWFWVEIAILQELHWLHAMWGLPVVLGIIATIPLIPSRHEKMIRAGLICGILSSVLYVAINIIVQLQWDDYNAEAQAVSELSAIDAPTRTLWSILATPYTLLMLAFGWSVWKSSRENRPLRIAGILLFAYASLGFLWPFAPMHSRETLVAGGGTFSDTMHIILGVITEILYLLALGFAAAALGKKFRIYSIITFIVLIFFGILTFRDAPGIAKNLPTPMIGIWERINIGVFLLWVVVLAIVLWNREKLALSAKVH